MNPPMNWIIAGLVALGVGALYYSPKSPTGRIWAAELKKQNPKLKLLLTPEATVAATALTNIVLTGILCKSHDFSEVKLPTFFAVGVKITLITALMELPHVLFAGSNMMVFLIDRGATALSLAVMLLVANLLHRM